MVQVQLLPSIDETGLLSLNIHIYIANKEGTLIPYQLVFTNHANLYNLININYITNELNNKNITDIEQIKNYIKSYLEVISCSNNVQGLGKESNLCPCCLYPLFRLNNEFYCFNINCAKFNFSKNFFYKFKALGITNINDTEIIYDLINRSKVFNGDINNSIRSVNFINFILNIAINIKNNLYNEQEVNLLLTIIEKIQQLDLETLFKLYGYPLIISDYINIFISYLNNNIKDYYLLLENNLNQNNNIISNLPNVVIRNGNNINEYLSEQVVDSYIKHSFLLNRETIRHLDILKNL